MCWVMLLVCKNAEGGCRHSVISANDNSTLYISKLALKLDMAQVSFR